MKVKEEEKNMCFPNDVALKTEKLNKYRFELGTVGERNKIMKDLVLLRKRLKKERRGWYNK